MTDLKIELLAITLAGLRIFSEFVNFRVFQITNFFLNLVNLVKIV